MRRRMPKVTCSQAGRDGCRSGNAAQEPALKPARRRVCDTRKSMYKRIVLKLSGEALAGPQGFGLDAVKVAEITGELAEVHALGVEIGVVVGGGNFFRGVSEQAKKMDRVSADNMGIPMLSALTRSIFLACSETPRKKFPPPTTTPISTPRACTSANSPVISATLTASRPKPCGPANASPDSFRTMRL